MKKLFTIAALFLFMISMTSFVPNEIGGGKVPGGMKNITTCEIGGGKVPRGI